MMAGIGRAEANRVRRLIRAAAGALGMLGLALGQAEAGSAPALDQLIERFNAAAPVQDGVTVEGWVERGPAGAELVVRLEPQGEIKLIADPGITVTPRPRPGVAWLTGCPIARSTPRSSISPRRPRCGCRSARATTRRSSCWSSTPTAWSTSSASSARRP